MKHVSDFPYAAIANNQQNAFKYSNESFPLQLGLGISSTFECILIKTTMKRSGFISHFSFFFFIN